MYGVFFRSGDLTFVDPDEFTTPAVKAWKSVFNASAELASSAKVALGGAPFASWVLARFAGLSESSLFPAEFVRREGELGGYRLRLLAVLRTEPVAKLRIAAERGAIELVATAADSETATLAARNLTATLLTEPATLGQCRIGVRARELGNHCNEYGFDGTILLGNHNIYE